MSQDDIKYRNEQIATFLGWWQKSSEGRPYAWWNYDGLSATIATYELNFHKDWNQLMLAVEAVTHISTVRDSPPKNQKNYILLDELKISRVGFYLTAYKDSVKAQPAEQMSFLYRYLPDDVNSSNATSYIESIWLGISDFSKAYNEYIEVE